MKIVGEEKFPRVLNTTYCVSPNASFNIEALVNGTYWRAALNSVRPLFQMTDVTHKKFQKFVICSSQTTNNNYHYDI